MEQGDEKEGESILKRDREQDEKNANETAVSSRTEQQ